jgi:hypothetical protein
MGRALARKSAKAEALGGTQSAGELPGLKGSGEEL